MDERKGFSHVLLILLVALLIISSILFIIIRIDSSQNNDSTSGQVEVESGEIEWLHFSSDDPALSFDFPSDWNIKELGTNSTVLLFKFYVSNKEEAWLTSVSIRMVDSLSKSASSEEYKNDSLLSLLNQWEYTCPWPSCNGNPPRVVEETEFNGYPMVKTKIRSQHPSYFGDEFDRYYLMSGRNVYSVSFPVGFFETESNKENVSVVESVLDTLVLY